MLKDLLTNSLEKVVNHYLRCDADYQHFLQPLVQKIICLEILKPSLTLHLEFTPPPACLHLEFTLPLNFRKPDVFFALQHVLDPGKLQARPW